MEEELHPAEKMSPHKKKSGPSAALKSKQAIQIVELHRTSSFSFETNKVCQLKWPQKTLKNVSSFCCLMPRADSCSQFCLCPLYSRHCLAASPAKTPPHVEPEADSLVPAPLNDIFHLRMFEYYSLIRILAHWLYQWIQSACVIFRF